MILDKEWMDKQTSVVAWKKTSKSSAIMAYFKAIVPKSSISWLQVGDVPAQ